MPNYDSDLRRAAANKVLETEKAAGSRWTATIRVAAEIGCSVTTLRRWVRVIAPGQRPRAVRRSAVRRATASSMASQPEVGASPG